MTPIVAGIVGIILVVGPHLETLEGHPLVDRVLTGFGVVLLGLFVLDAPTVTATITEHALRAGEEAAAIFQAWAADHFDFEVQTPMPPATTTVP